VEKERMTSESADEALAKIEFTTDIDALKDLDFLVEAVIENIDLKRDLYTTLGDLCKPETVFASNTSSLSIGEMASFSKRPDRFLGVHFFNPVQVRRDPLKNFMFSFRQIALGPKKYFAKKFPIKHF